MTWVSDIEKVDAPPPADWLIVKLESVFRRLYRFRHPGRLGRWIISLLRPYILRQPPNDGWSLHVFLPEWLKAIDAKPVLPLPPSQRIFLFSCYRGSCRRQLLQVILLAWRGHKVTLGYLPDLTHPVRPGGGRGASAKRYLAAALALTETLTGGRVRCYDLSDDLEDGMASDEEFVTRQIHSDLIHRLQKEFIDLNDPEVSALKVTLTRETRETYRAASNHLKKHRVDYDLGLICNGSTFRTAAVCQAAKNAGLPINSYEVFSFTGIRIVNHGDHSMNFDDLDLAWELREKIGLLNEPCMSKACDVAMALLEQRRRGSTENWNTLLQIATRQQTATYLAKCGLQLDAPFILVCPNVPFDAGYEKSTTIFPSMRAWLERTLIYLASHTDMPIIVRAHPAENLWGSNETTKFIVNNLDLDAQNVHTIDYDAPVNTYDLIEHCNFGVVFSSTTGLEMVMMGKTAIIGSEIYYTGRGFTVDADNQNGYFNNLDRGLHDPQCFGVSTQQAKQAQLFHFILHFLIQWPYPVRAEHYAPGGLTRLLESEEAIDLAQTLDAMATPPQQWRARALDFLAVDRNPRLKRLLAAD